MKIGSANLVVAIDARRRDGGALVAERAERGSEHDYEAARSLAGPGDSPWEVATHGGSEPTGIDAVEWARFAARAGAGEILLTSMDRDGTKQGYDLELLRAVADAVPVPVIASGGGGSAEDLAAALDDGPGGGHCQAALAASIFHFGEVTVGDVKRRLGELTSRCVLRAVDAAGALC